jgi:hypothetical protein
MATRLTVEELIKVLAELAPKDRARVARALAQDSTEPLHDITELRGLGKEVWQNIDAQDYVDSERDAWDR